MNYFHFNTSAKRYAKGRPYFHPLVIEKIVTFTACDRFEHGIDVGCGTGQSSRALRKIADNVTGTDVSEEMINFAPRTEGLQYVCCPAEELLVDDNAFDIMTLALVFHWLDREAFFREARRVLQPASWMIIYQNGFSGKMEGNPDYAEWNKERYVQKYPTPPRNTSPFNGEIADSYGFDLLEKENFSNQVEMFLEEWICYLSTQSNMIAAIESGRERAEEALEWLHNELDPIFTAEKEVFNFVGNITYLKMKA